MVALVIDMVAEEPMPTGSASQKLEAISQAIAGCQKCPLAETRTQTVPGEGSATAEIMFVGEGPGRDEDLSGRPFVGRAGKFLDELIESLPMRREDVYIANVVKCRPPGNRDPERIEVDTCSGYLTEQIETIDPLVIVPLGRHALGWFVSNPRITADHGKIMRYQNRILMPLLHPSAGLRSTENARRLREGIHGVREALLEGIRLRQDTKVREANHDGDSTGDAEQADEKADAVTTPDGASEVPDRQDADETSASTGLFERSQTQDEVQAEIRRQRAIEEAEAAAEEEQAKIVVDDRQASFF